MTEERGDRRPAGELEARVLATLWAADGGLTAGQVRTALGSGLARTTVTTILVRLYEKGIVTRSRSGRGYAYLPTADAPGLSARRMRAELDRGEDRDSILAQFVSHLGEEDEKTLRALLNGGEEAGT